MDTYRHANNATLNLSEAESTAYVQAIAKAGKKYDLVVVDGHQRVECIRVGVEWLTPRGVLVLDNSYRQQYREGFDLLAARGLRSLTFRGPAPHRRGDRGIHDSLSRRKLPQHLGL